MADKINDTTATVAQMKQLMKDFVRDRDWIEYHDPKSLSMSIAIEAAELMEKFQFLTTHESHEIAESHKQEIQEELSDIFGYVLGFANATGIDLSSAFVQKMEKNRQKYPVEKARGAFGKYTKLDKKKE